MSDRFNRYRYVTPTELGLSEVLLTGVTTSNTFDTGGCNRMTLLVFFTRVAGTGNLDLTLEAYDQVKNDWVFVNTTSVSSGVITLSDGTFRKATGSATCKYEIRLTDLLFEKMRIKTVAVTSASTDTLSISAYLGYGA